MRCASKSSEWSSLSSTSSRLDDQNEKCKACSYTSDKRKKMSDHESVHFVRKCLNCQKFIRNNTFPAHKRQCQTLTLQKLYCGLENCNFSTYYDFSLRRHRKRHEGSFKCVSCSCPRFFRTKEKLEKHSIPILWRVIRINIVESALNPPAIGPNM